MILPALPLLCLGLAPVPTENAIGDPARELRGEWVVTSCEAFGKREELHLGDVFTFDGERLRHDGPGEGEPLEYVISLAANAKPKRMDWRPAKPKDAPWSHRGIYKLDGGKLTICVIARFAKGDKKDRPTEFRTALRRQKRDAAGGVLLVLERRE